MRKEYTDFDLWKADVEELGWVHTHDEFVVCDDENDICVGEFSSTTNTGWIDTPNNHYAAVAQLVEQVVCSSQTSGTKHVKGDVTNDFN